MAEHVLPSEGQRYRCAGCGNLTRFDIESVERVRRFWHAELSGQGQVESEERLETHVERVTCRWCGTGSNVEVIDAPSGDTAADAPRGDTAADAPSGDTAADAPRGDTAADAPT